MLRQRLTIDGILYQRGDWPTRKGRVKLYLNLEIVLGIDSSGVNRNELRIYDTFDGDINKRSRIYLFEEYYPPYQPGNSTTAAMMQVDMLVSSENHIVNNTKVDNMWAWSSTEDNNAYREYISYSSDETKEKNILANNRIITLCPNTAEIYPSKPEGYVINYVVRNGGYLSYPLKSEIRNINSIYIYTNAKRWLDGSGNDRWPNYTSENNYWTRWYKYDDLFSLNFGFKFDKTNITITDNSSSASNGIILSSEDIKATNTDTIIVKPNSPNTTIEYMTFVSESTPDSSALNFSYNNNKITVTSNRNPVYSNHSEKVKVSSDIDLSFNVNFFELVRDIEISNNSLISMNIKDTDVSTGFNVTGYTNSTGKILRKVTQNKNYPGAINNDVFSNNFLNIRNYLDYNRSNAENFFKIENEKRQQEINWIFYNNDVNNYYYQHGNKAFIGNNTTYGYNKRIDTKVIWYITPNTVDNLSYEWLDKNGNVLAEGTEPDIILPDFELPVIGNLQYLNTNTEDGFCRAFKVQFLNESGTLIKENIFDATVTNDGNNQNAISTRTGIAITKDNTADLPFNEPITVKIVACFYFGNKSPEKDKSIILYEGVSKTLQQKLYRVNSKDFKPFLVFPDYSYNSNMMLPEVERLGYSLPSDETLGILSVLLQQEFDLDFGVSVNGEEYTIRNNPTYFSSVKLTQNIVVNIGKIVKDNAIYSDNVEIKAFIKVIASNENSTNVDSNPITISTSTIWYRPTVDKGEYLTYFDYDRFMQFINKYHVLYNNEMLNVPTEKRGEIINTDFWNDVADILDEYAQYMQNWATDVSNSVVLWALPEFKHKKGEIITNNNLYQNYWDLLVQHDGYSTFSTHDYLHNSGYTHNFLHNYTHDEILNNELN